MIYVPDIFNCNYCKIHVSNENGPEFVIYFANVIYPHYTLQALVLKY